MMTTRPIRDTIEADNSFLIDTIVHCAKKIIYDTILMHMMPKII